jgi:hypothetical protein
MSSVLLNLRTCGLGDLMGFSGTMGDAPTRTCIAAVCCGLLKSVLAYRTRNRPNDSMTRGSDELQDLDAAELLRVGADASCVLVCGAAELVRVNGDAKQNRDE